MFIFDVHGEGGVGKSTLLERWRQICRELGALSARVDENCFSLPEMMSAIVEQLGRPEETAQFTARYAEFLRARERIENDPQVFNSPPVQELVSLKFADASHFPGASGKGGAERIRQLLGDRPSDSRDLRLLLSPIKELSPTFISALNSAASKTQVVMMFDTFEHIAAVAETWLLDVLAGRYGELNGTVHLVIAGRSPLNANRWSDYRDAMSSVSLNPFTDQEARQLLRENGITDEATVAAILSLSGKLPLLTGMLAKSRPRDASAVGDPADTAVERFLKWESDENRRRAAVVGALPRRIDCDLLAAVTDVPDAPALYEWLMHQAFVRHGQGGSRYHDVVRLPMIRWQRQQSLERWRADHARLARVYQRRADMAGTAEWTNEEWLNNHVELTYHSLCTGEIDLRDAAEGSVEAAKIGVSAARRWAEMLSEAGRDGDSNGTEAAGDALRSAIGSEETDCLRVLTTILNLNVLSDEKEAEALVERARIKYYANKDEDAIEDCTQALLRRPQSSEAYAVRGAARGFIRHHDDALADFDRAIELDPDYSWALICRGNTYLAVKRYDDALADFARAIQLSPRNDWAIAYRGEAFRVMERYDDALADLNRAIELDPDYQWAIASRGSTYLAMKRYGDALVDFDRAIKLDREYQWAIAGRGRTYLSMKRFDDALVDFDRSIEINPDYPWAMADRGENYRLMKRYDDALTDFDRAIETDSEFDWAIASRGDTYRNMKRYDDALIDYNRAIDLNPGADWIIAGRGVTYLLMNRYDEALADLNRAIELDPTDDWAVGNRGETYRLMKRYDEALADFNRAIEIDPDDPWHYGHRGRVRQAVGEVDLALEDFRRATEIAPVSEWVAMDPEFVVDHP